jgi:hypothetical protein
MIESGEDLGTVSRILGHADFATTADVYAHLTPAMLDRAAERMDAISVAKGYEQGCRPNERPLRTAARGHFVLGCLVGATGFEPATS